MDINSDTTHRSSACFVWVGPDHLTHDQCPGCACICHTPDPDPDPEWLRQMREVCQPSTAIVADLLGDLPRP